MRGGQSFCRMLSKRSGGLPGRLLRGLTRDATAGLAGQAPPGKHLCRMLAPPLGEGNENLADAVWPSAYRRGQILPAPAESRRFKGE